MNKFTIIFLGAFFTIAFSFTGIVLMSQIQYGGLKPIAMEEGGELYPKEPVGLAQQGKIEYENLGCLYCHSQQVRAKGYGADFERGWGDRQTVARDYILQKRVVLGTMRTGPDLMNVGERLTSEDWHYLHLYDPQLTSKGSVMSPFRYLFKEQLIGEKPSADALKFPPDYVNKPQPGHEIVPTDRARKLVQYLLSLKLDYEFPEARFTQ